MLVFLLRKKPTTKVWYLCYSELDYKIVELLIVVLLICNSISFYYSFVCLSIVAVNQKDRFFYDLAHISVFSQRIFSQLMKNLCLSHIRKYIFFKKGIASRARTLNVGASLHRRPHYVCPNRECTCVTSCCICLFEPCLF